MIKKRLFKDHFLSKDGIIIVSGKIDGGVLTNGSIINYEGIILDSEIPTKNGTHFHLSELLGFRIRIFMREPYKVFIGEGIRNLKEIEGIKYFYVSYNENTKEGDIFKLELIPEACYKENKVRFIFR
jgi:hypothetical protein